MPAPPTETIRCGQCGTELPRNMLSCPGCGRLAHADELKALAGEADTAEQRGDFISAMGAWLACAKSECRAVSR